MSAPPWSPRAVPAGSPLAVVLNVYAQVLYRRRLMTWSVWWTCGLLLVAVVAAPVLLGPPGIAVTLVLGLLLIGLVVTQLRRQSRWRGRPFDGWTLDLAARNVRGWRSGLVFLLVPPVVLLGVGVATRGVANLGDVITVLVLALGAMLVFSPLWGPPLIVGSRRDELLERHLATHPEQWRALQAAAADGAGASFVLQRLAVIRADSPRRPPSGA